MKRKEILFFHLLHETFRAFLLLPVACSSFTFSIAFITNITWFVTIYLFFLILLSVCLPSQAPFFRIFSPSPDGIQFVVCTKCIMPASHKNVFVFIVPFFSKENRGKFNIYFCKKFHLICSIFKWRTKKCKRNIIWSRRKFKMRNS